MICDKLKNAELYFSLKDKFPAAFDFINRAIKENYQVGKYEIDGENLYAIVQEYVTKPLSEGVYEGHEKYIDIQFIISGVEQIGVADIGKLKAKTKYNAENDFCLYENINDDSNIVLKENDFAVFFPHDLHKPGLAFENNPTAIKKIVVKVKI